ncbi:MAG: hypothetical protein V4731_03425 [Pseudomonadota bacterium]
MRRSDEGSRKSPRGTTGGTKGPADSSSENGKVPPLCWPFPAGSQNDTDRAVKPKAYVSPKRRTLNQY